MYNNTSGRSRTSAWPEEKNCSSVRSLDVTAHGHMNNKRKRCLSKVERYSYFGRLIGEYWSTDNQEHKLQVCANLANFAFDPYNHEILVRTNGLAVFLDALKSSNIKMAAFGMSGFCNLSMNDRAAGFILTNCLSLMKRFFDGSQFSDEVLVPALTCLIFLCEPLKIEEIKAKVDVAALIRLFKNGSQNRRLCNVLFILLVDKMGFDSKDIT